MPRCVGTIRQRRIPALLVSGVVAKMKKLARLDVAERRHMQCGTVRLLDFHGSPADFEVTTRPVEDSETLILRRLLTRWVEFAELRHSRQVSGICSSAYLGHVHRFTILSAPLRKILLIGGPGISVRVLALTAEEAELLLTHGTAVADVRDSV